jgi:hypothetical protein
MRALRSSRQRPVRRRPFAHHRKCTRRGHRRRKCDGKLRRHRKCARKARPKRRSVGKIRRKRNCVRKARPKRRSVGKVRRKRRCVRKVHRKRRCVRRGPGIHKRRCNRKVSDRNRASRSAKRGYSTVAPMIARPNASTRSGRSVGAPASPCGEGFLRWADRHRSRSFVADSPTIAPRARYGVPTVQASKRGTLQLVPRTLCRVLWTKDAERNAKTVRHRMKIDLPAPSTDQRARTPLQHALAGS